MRKVCVCGNIKMRAVLCSPLQLGPCLRLSHLGVPVRFQLNVWSVNGAVGTLANFSSVYLAHALRPRSHPAPRCWAPCLINPWRGVFYSSTCRSPPHPSRFFINVIRCCTWSCSFCTKATKCKAKHQRPLRTITSALFLYCKAQLNDKKGRDKVHHVHSQTVTPSVANHVHRHRCRSDREP